MTSLVGAMIAVMVALCVAASEAMTAMGQQLR
jgi:hypothetical protein